MIITRSNDRRLRLTATDWVKNGDRWTITGIGRQRRPESPTQPQPPHRPAARRLCPRVDRSRLRHHHPCRPRRLRRHHARPRHRAGITAAAVHHAHPRPARQPPLPPSRRRRRPAHRHPTRDRRAPHADRDAAADPRPRRQRPPQPPPLLRELSDPAARLFDAVQRYTDGLHVAAEQLLGPQIVQMLDGRADQVVPDLTNEPSWPTLRAHLLTLAAETGEHPLLHLHTAAAGRELHTAADMAAVLDWRLPEPAPTDPGPLPWLPGIPQALHDHPVWGQYLAKRSQLVTDLANQIRGHAGQDDTQPVWAPPGSHPNLAIIGEVAVWRAANGIHPNDPRPTGAAQLQTASALWQHHLDRSLARGSDDNIGRLDIPEPPPARTSRDRRHQDRQRLPQPPAVRPNSPPRAGP